jgi:hypothetical protein
MDNPIAVEPQPRVDTLVIDAGTGASRRRTEYSGSVWFGGKPTMTGFGIMTTSRAAQVQTPFYLPDSLPYRVGTPSLIAVSVAVQSAPDEGHQVMEYQAQLVPDPRNPVVAWVQLQVLAGIRTPTAVSYRVDVLVPPDGVLTDAPGA